MHVSSMYDDYIKMVVQQLREPLVLGRAHSSTSKQQTEPNNQDRKLATTDVQGSWPRASPRRKKIPLESSTKVKGGGEKERNTQHRIDTPLGHHRAQCCGWSSEYGGTRDEGRDRM